MLILVILASVLTFRPSIKLNCAHNSVLNAFVLFFIFISKIAVLINERDGIICYVMSFALSNLTMYSTIFLL